VLGTGQRSNDVVAKDVQTMSNREECVLGMGLRSNFAAEQDH